MSALTRTATSERASREALRELALAHGFDAVGFARAELASVTRRHLGQFLAAGLPGDMGWLADSDGRRGDPRRLWPEARSVIVVGLNYGPSEDPLVALERRERGTISVYAQGRDYHLVMKKQLKAFAGELHDRYNAEVKVFVDTAPVMEKPLAQAGALGWQGKHTNLVSREFGSWLFLGEVFTTLDIEPDPPEEDHCGACQRCLDVCPTRAFPAPYQLDARRCISYLTIEHKGHIPRDLRPLIGNRIYGCDDCLAVCPWNKFAVRASHAELWPRAELTAPRLADLARLDEATFREVFSGSPIKRTGRDRFVRNVLVAIGNSGVADLAAAAREQLVDASPLVRAAAIWALSRLLPPDAFARERASRIDAETDAEVRSEWLESAST